MADVLHLEVATPERLLVRDDVSEVQVPGWGGYLGILPGHAALISKLGTGFLWYMTGGRRRYLSVAGGFLEVKDDHVRVLADAAERAEEIDVQRARRALQRAQEQLTNPALGVDPAAALEAMERAAARLSTAEQK
jgi:F-type H+-transporting ATPase subunit epsilon